MSFGSEQSPENPVLLFRSHNYVAIRKPAGWIVHPSGFVGAAPTCTEWLRGCDGIERVYPVHRLDRPTEGVVLFALSSEAASRVAEQFRHHEIRKRYFAVVRGWPPEEGLIERALTNGPEPGDEEERVPARTRFRVCARTEVPVSTGPHPGTRLALVELLPETGRYHQLRRHLNGQGYPLIGDTRYAPGALNRMAREYLGFHRLALFSQQLEFKDPDSGGWIRLTAPLSEDWRRLLENLGWSGLI